MTETVIEREPGVTVYSNANYKVAVEPAAPGQPATGYWIVNLRTGVVEDFANALPSAVHIADHFNQKMDNIKDKLQTTH